VPVNCYAPTNKIFLQRTFFSGQNSQGGKDATLNEFPRSTCFRKLSYLFRRGYRRHAVAKLCFKLKLYAVLYPGSYSAVIRAKCTARMFPFTNPEPGDIAHKRLAAYTQAEARTFLWRRDARGYLQ